ncbi:MAG: prepilin-type N-terminal cleavage/methylation domain-containing protein [Candidatus Paceibacteria bacterium]|jgi:prepilin-type N-terminal cleavage/methylation domain-containing protein
MKNITTNKGFTLIELLVVISIIGLLSSVVLASLGEVRTKAGISSMQQEGIQLRTALELYRSKNGEYPSNGRAYLSNPDNASSSWSIQLKLSEEISSVMPTLKNGIPGVTFYSGWAPPSHGNMLYFNTETYYQNAWVTSYYCEGATIDAPYKVVFIVTTAYKSKFDGKFPKLLSGGNHISSSSWSYYCAFVPPN